MGTGIKKYNRKFRNWKYTRSIKGSVFDTGLEDELNEGLKLHPMFVISNYKNVMVHLQF